MCVLPPAEHIPYRHHGISPNKEGTFPMTYCVVGIFITEGGNPMVVTFQGTGKMSVTVGKDNLL